MRYQLTRLFLFLLFSSYLIIMILANADRLVNFTKPLDLLGLSRVVEVEKDLYVGSYADENILKLYGIRTVVSTLDPKAPLSRELFNAQKRLCGKLKIDFVSIPIHHSEDEEDPGVKKLLEFLRGNPKKPIYINGFLFDKYLSKLLEYTYVMEHQGIK